MPKTEKTGAGELTEQLTILTSTPVIVSVVSITRVGAVATVTTASAHGFTTGDYVTHSGAAQAEYNGEAPVTVTGATTYTFAVSGTPVTPATGTIAVVFTSDGQGGQGSGWYTLDTVWGSMTALSASELLQAQAIGSVQTYRGKIYDRGDVTPKMRVQWTPYLAASPKTLEIHGVLEDKDEPRRFKLLDVGEVI